MPCSLKDSWSNSAVLDNGREHGKGGCCLIFGFVDKHECGFGFVDKPVKKAKQWGDVEKLAIGITYSV